MFIKYGLITKDGEVSGIVNMDHVGHMYYEKNKYAFSSYNLKLDSSHSESYFLEFIFDSEEKAKIAYELFETVMSGLGGKSIEGVGAAYKV